MWGLLLIFFAVAYFSAVGLLLFKVKPIWGKGLVLIAAILIPNADDWYYRSKLADYCKSEAGFKIYQQVSRKEGLASPTSSYDGSSLKNISVSYIEWPETIGGNVIGFWRADRLDDGSASKPYKIPEYTAHYEHIRIEKKDGPFTSVRLQVVDRPHRNVIGEFKGTFYYGGWYPGALVGTGGLVAGCGKGGQVVPHREWRGEMMKDYDGNVNSQGELINRIFSKE